MPTTSQSRKLRGSEIRERRYSCGAERSSSCVKLLCLLALLSRIERKFASSCVPARHDRTDSNAFLLFIAESSHPVRTRERTREIFTPLPSSVFLVRLDALPLSLARHHQPYPILFRTPDIPTPATYHSPYFSRPTLSVVNFHANDAAP